MQHALSTPDRVCPSWSVLLCVHRSRLSLCVQLTAHEVHITYCTYVVWKIMSPVALLYLCFMFFSDYRSALSLVSFTSNFSERLSTFTYSYQESCSLYPRCTPYISVEHTVSPQSTVGNSSSGCSVEYTIHNLMRCVSYQSTATILIGNQRGNPVVIGDIVMQSEWLQLIWGWTG